MFRPDNLLNSNVTVCRMNKQRKGQSPNISKEHTCSCRGRCLLMLRAKTLVAINTYSGFEISTPRYPNDHVSKNVPPIRMRNILFREC